MNILKSNKLQKTYTLVGAALLVLVVIMYILTPSKQTPDGKLELLSVSPEPPIMASIWSTEPVVFSFDKPLDKESIKYNIMPPTESKIVQTGKVNEFSIVPLSGWEEEVEYTITLSANISSLTGEKLGERKSFSFIRRPDYSQYPVEESEQYDFEI